MEKQEKGICRLSVIPVRREPSDKSEMVTQLLFGEHYSVAEYATDKKWIHIIIEFDGYPGWIDVKQHTPISLEYFNHLNNTEFKIATDLTSTILYKKRMIQILIGSILPISSAELFEVKEQFAFNGNSKNVGEKKDFDFLKQMIIPFMNAPYLWGGRSPFGIDCSGFVQQIFNFCGYRLNRDAHQQFKNGEAVQSFEDAIPGDLAFFGKDTTHISHVGIVLEQNRIVHASGFVRTDKLDKEGIYNEELSGYTHKLAGLRRIFKT